MLTFTSSRSGNERTVDINAQACMQARFDGESWDTMYVGKASTPEEDATRAERFGADCKGATLTDARKSPEWADAAEAFAVEGGHDVDAVVKTMVYKVRGSNGPRAVEPREAAVPAMSPAEQVLRSQQRIAVAELEAAQTTAVAELKAAHVKAMEELNVSNLNATQALVIEHNEALDALKAEEEAAAAKAAAEQAEREAAEQAAREAAELKAAEEAAAKAAAEEAAREAAEQAAAEEAAAAEVAREAEAAEAREAHLLRKEAELKKMLAEADTDARRESLTGLLHKCRDERLQPAEEEAA